MLNSYAEVRVSLQTGDVRVLSQTSANVYLKGFENPLSLVLTAHVRPHLRVIPRSLDFGELDYMETRSLTLRVHQNGPVGPELERVEVDLQAVRTEVICKTKAPPHLWEVSVTLDGKDVTVPVEFRLRLVRSDGEMMTLPIYARPGWGFEVKPDAPVVIVDSEPGVARVRIRSRDGFPFVIEGVEASHSFVEVETPGADVLKLDHEVLLKVLECPLGSEPREKGSAVVSVGHYAEQGKQEATLTVPFTYWFVSDAPQTAQQATQSDQGW